MTLGISSYLANKLLDHTLRNTAYTPPTTVYAKIHTSAGEPGAAGTSNASAQTTRVAVSFAAASGGSSSMSAAIDFTLNASETIAYVTFWDASTSGNFLWSVAAAASKSGVSGDIIRISTNTMSFTIAA